MSNKYQFKITHVLIISKPDIVVSEDKAMLSSKRQSSTTAEIMGLVNLSSRFNK